MDVWRAKKAKWVWLDGPDKPANGYVYFRKVFEIQSTPDHMPCYVSADCRYLLSVNGTVVGRGPVTTDPKYKQVDIYEISSYLRKGQNVIAAVVLHRQNQTSRLWPKRGGFIFELISESLCIATDETWRARWATEYKADTPYMTHQYGNQEWYDARKTPVGWELLEYDDCDWLDCRIVENSEDSWPEELEIRQVPHMLREVIHPTEVVSYFGLSTNGRPAEKDKEPARQIMNGYPMSSVVAWDIDNLMSPEKGPAILMERYGDGVGIVVDLGEEMIGYPFIDIECPEGVTVDIGHGEILSRNRIQTVLMPESGAEQRYADRYISRQGRQRFEILDSKGCRYLEIHFNRLADFYKGAKIIIHEIGMMRSHAPFKLISEFSCSDERLDQIWDICRRTALVKCLDWHICDAQREQNNWPELYQDMLYFQCFGKIEMVRQMIHMFCRAQTSTGYFPSTLPAIGKDVESLSENDFYLFSTLSFPLIVYFDWLYGGPDERLSYWLDCCRKSFDALAEHMGPNGVLANLPGNHFVEWSGLDVKDGLIGGAKRTWEMPACNAYHILSLERMADVAKSLNKTDWADSWLQRADKLRTACQKHFWSEHKGAYPDGIYDGKTSDTISQSTNALAVLARLGSEERLKQIIATIEDPHRCDVPSATLMPMYHEALESMGLDEHIPEQIKKRWGYMLDHGATTTWESIEALERNMGLCFGFAGHPLNFMARNFLGVVPLEPGYAKFSVRIKPFNLDCAEGKIATPHGYIEISWSRTDNSLQLQLLVPDNTTALVSAPHVPLWKDSVPKITVDNKTVDSEVCDIAVCSFLRAPHPVVKVGSGKHVVMFSYNK